MALNLYLFLSAHRKNLSLMPACYFLLIEIVLYWREQNIRDSQYPSFPQSYQKLHCIICCFTGFYRRNQFSLERIIILKSQAKLHWNLSWFFSVLLVLCVCHWQDGSVWAADNTAEFLLPNWHDHRPQAPVKHRMVTIAGTHYMRMLSCKV